MAKHGVCVERSSKNYVLQFCRNHEVEGPKLHRNGSQNPIKSTLWHGRVGFNYIFHAVQTGCNFGWNPKPTKMLKKFRSWGARGQKGRSRDRTRPPLLPYPPLLAALAASRQRKLRTLSGFRDINGNNESKSM